MILSLFFKKKWADYESELSESSGDDVIATVRPPFKRKLYRSRKVPSTIEIPDSLPQNQRHSTTTVFQPQQGDDLSMTEDEVMEHVEVCNQ